MKLSVARLFPKLCLIVGLPLLGACGGGGGGDGDSSINPPAPPPPPAAAAPTIATFQPDQGGFDTEVTIAGTNFSSTPAGNTVTFNGVTALVTAAGTTELKVLVPKNTSSTGNVRVTVANQTATSGRVFTYVPTLMVSTLAGTGSPGFADGPGDSAQFNTPIGIIVDASGMLVVADAENNRIRTITPDGLVSTLAGTGEVGFENGPIASAKFHYPEYLALDPTGNMYVSDSENNSIRKITAEGMVSTVAGTDNQGYRNGPGADALFTYPEGIALNAAGSLYVADNGNNCIRAIAPDGTVSTVAGAGPTGCSFDPVDLQFPHGVAVDTAGTIYVSEVEGHRISRVAPNGTVTTLAGTGVPGLADGPALEAQFDSPLGLTVDNAGVVYVAEWGNHRIRKITPDGTVSTLAGAGTPGFANGPADNAQFNTPASVALDSLGNLYVTDAFNHRIRKIAWE
ncbi:MAG: IPT/TIG domain-containing protein [Nevskiaceae bacterium]|jgi:sugar lactone lactonase YvrE|nr:IPT/TIG domain-containing protein [Nevskiaceae bacterium]